MKLSKKGTYALRALRHLAEAGEGTFLSVADLAEREDIPVKFLEQILAILRTQGVLVSRRGKEGGYALRLSPGQVTLGDVIRAVDGPLAPLPCASRTATAPCEEPDCPYEFETCWLRLLMLRVRDNISAILDEETLEDMAGSAADSQLRT
jgi:Rrf2 family protein